MNRITKGGFGKTVAAVLLVAMVFSGVPVLGVNAQENDETVATVQGEQQDSVDNQQETENTESSQEGTEEENQEPVQDVPEEGTESTDSIQQPAEVTEPQSEENSEQAGKLNYLYLGSDYIEAPGTQNIMVSWGTGEENVSAMKLVYVNAQNEETVLDAEKQEDNTWLFSKEFSESETGVYTLLRLETEADGMVENYIFEDAGMNVLFGVNEGVNEEEVSEHIDMDSFETEEEQETNVETSVVALSEEGEEAVESIASALGEAEQQTENSASASLRSRAATFSTRSSDLVIVLDPGHDSSHTGASGNGVREEVATLKIAQYCREELEQYEGVTVYMTRENAACPYPETIGVSSGNILDIKKRVQWAASQGADAFISIHLNSSTSSSANGAQVFYPEASFAGSSVANEGAALANKIQQELLALGLNRRANDDADYAVNTESAKYGFPGLIIEHAFVSNASDANNYLNSDDKLKRLGIADATGIANYYGLSKEGNSVSVETGTYTITTAVNDNKVIGLEKNSMENGVKLQIQSETNLSTQRFEISAVGNGYYRIVSEATGKALDIPNASSATQIQIQQYTWNASNAQLWKFIDAGEGYCYIRSALGTYVNLKWGNAEDGNVVWTYTNDKSNAMKWRLNTSTFQPIPDGTYNIFSQLNGMTLSIRESSLSNWGNAQIETNTDSSSQKFEITYMGNGYYKIVNEYSGKALDIWNGLSDSGTNVQQYEWNGSNAQLWKFVEIGDGSYYIKSKLGTVLNVENAGTMNGTNVDSSTMDGSMAQRWNIKTAKTIDIKEGTYVIKSAGNLYQVLTEKNSNFQINGFDCVDNQKFKITPIEDGYYKIENLQSGKVLDIANNSTKVRANVRPYTWNGTSAQLWKFIPDGEGGYYLKSKSGMILDISNGVFQDNTNVQTYTMNGSQAQRWILDSEMAAVESGKTVEEGTYTIIAQVGSNMVLEVAGGSLDNRANVQIYAGKNAVEQKFEVKYVGDGYYKIISEKSGRVLDVNNASLENGANVQQYKWNGTDAQLWKFVKNSDGTYFIKSKLGLALDVHWGGSSNGTNVDVYSLNGTNAQKWTLEAAEVKNITEGKYVLANASSSEKVLTSLKDNAQINTFENYAEQKVQIEYVGNGYYKIVNCDSGKVLSIKGNSNANNANVYFDKWQDEDGQLWKFINIGNSTYYIRSGNGVYLDVRWGDLTDGTNIQTYEANGTKAQCWTLNKQKAEEAENMFPEGDYIIYTSLSYDKVLDIQNGSQTNGGNVQIYLKNGTAAQEFTVEYVSNGYYKIISKISGLVLDIKNGSSSSGANVQQYEWNGTDAQLWRFVECGDGNYFIKSKLGTVLDVKWGGNASGTNVDAYSLNKTSAQKWYLEKTDRSNLIEDGIYTIQSVLSDTAVLDIKNGSGANGANLQIYTPNDTTAQKFKITYVGCGYYKIASEISGKVLDVKYGSASIGATVWQYDWNASDAQMWRFVSAGNGQYIIYSKLGTVLDVSGARTVPGTPVNTYSANETNAQKWILKSQGLYSIMGLSSTTLTQMVNYYNSRNSTYPYQNDSKGGATTITEFCKIYIEECAAEGVKAEVAFCQAMLETGFLKFGGDVKAEQYNFAGLGATGGGNSGEVFPDIRTGIRAQVQHLKAYASTESLNNKCVDNRFNYVKRGCAPYVEWLGQKENPNGYGWATGENYGYNILSNISILKSF